MNARLPHWISAFAVLACGAAYAPAKEVTIDRQNMLDPYRIIVESGEIEKATDYKINWRMFCGGRYDVKCGEELYPASPLAT